MESLNKYLQKSVETYTFERYCEDNNIAYEDITNQTHQMFVMENWCFVRHRPYYLYKSKIYESILKSYDAKKLYADIVLNFKEDIVSEYVTYQDKSTIKSLIIKYKRPDFIQTDKFQQLLNLYNYFITYNDTKAKQLHLEPNIPDDYTNYIYKDCKGIVYHVTTKDIYENKIKKYGLKPKTAEYRYFPQRVYCTSGTNKKEIKDNIDFVINILKEDPSYKSICILKIDLKEYNNNITIYKDNGMENDSYWTSEYIPPYCIEEVNYDEL